MMMMSNQMAINYFVGLCYLLICINISIWLLCWSVSHTCQNKVSTKIWLFSMNGFIPSKIFPYYNHYYVSTFDLVVAVEVVDLNFYLCHFLLKVFIPEWKIKLKNYSPHWLSCLSMSISLNLYQICVFSLQNSCIQENDFLV